MKRYISYAKPESHHDAEASMVRQFSAIEAMAALCGIKSELESRRGQSAGDTAVFASILRQLGAGDTLFVADISALGDGPTEVLRNASALVAKGVRVLVASLGGEVQLPTLRAYAGAFYSLETKLQKAEADLQKERKNHATELDEFCASYDRRVMEALAQRGITISQLTSGADPKTTIKQPSKGAELRTLRESLGLTQDNAGKLLEPPLGKSDVSRLEGLGTGKRIEELVGALEAQRYLRGKRLAPKPGGPLPHEIQTLHEHGLPTASEELAARSAH